MIIAFGANLGAIFGTYITEWLAEPLGVYQLLLVAAGILLLNLVLTNIVNGRDKRSPVAIMDNKKPENDKPMGKSGAFQLVFKSRYLLLIAFLMLILNWVNTTGEYILGKTVLTFAQEAVSSGAAQDMTLSQYLTIFYANFFRIVNIATLLIQLFVVSRILKYFDVRIAILVLPIIAMMGYSVLAFIPILAIVRIAKTAENSTDYSLQNTVRQILFLPTTREEKYKAKQAIDSFFVRAGDVFSAMLVYAGTTWLSFKVKDFALFNLVLVFIWLILAYIIGKENKRLVQLMNRQPENETPG